MDSTFYYYLLGKIFEHLRITFTALFLATALSIPLGILLAKTGKQVLASALLRIVAAIQTMPGLALIALMTAFLLWILPFFPIPTTGFVPGTLVLSVYAILPILHSTYGGIRGIGRPLTEVARGMGMTRLQMLYLVEFPLALPEIFRGIRTASIWTFGSATLTSLIGSGGLGDLLLQGLRSMNPSLLCYGTIPLMVLAVASDALIAKCASKCVQRRL